LFWRDFVCVVLGLVGGRFGESSAGLFSAFVAQFDVIRKYLTAKVAEKIG
jgi:hypothetical protein